MYPNPYESPDLNLPPKGFSSRVYAYRAAALQAIPHNVWTKVQFNAELFDTLDEFIPTAPDYTFTPFQAGYYLVTANIRWIAGGAAERSVRFWDGTWRAYTDETIALGAIITQALTAILYLTPLTVLEVDVLQNSGVPRNIGFGSEAVYLNIHRLS